MADDIKKIVIVGGGFGGVQCALRLARKKIPGVKIILISNKTYFEYTPSLYRVVTGRSPLGACLPLRDIFQNKEIEVLTDTIAKIDLKEKMIEGISGSNYSFDYLALAMGSETSYFNIPGLKELSFGFKSINESLRLKKRLHELFASAVPINIVVVGGGASGAELAGELAVYAKKLARHHGINPSLATIDLIEAGPRLLPAFPEDFADKVKDRLHYLGVNIFLNRLLVKEEIGGIYLKDMEIKTKTVIWTAGVKAHRLYSETPGFVLEKNGRVEVDEFLQARGWPNVFVIGDSADTLYSGTAQTAIRDGGYAAQAIISKMADKKLMLYRFKKPFYALPVGPGWAAVFLGKFKIYGKAGWLLRRLADLRYFISILPPKKALPVFLSSRTLCESCLICETEQD